MLLFFTLIFNYVIETSTGDLYALHNGNTSFIMNINDFDEDLRKMNLNPPSQLAFIENKKPLNAIENQSKSTLKKFYKMPHVFINRKGRIVVTIDGRMHVLPYTIFDVLKEPRFIEDALLFASKNIALQYVNNIGFFVVTITLHIKDKGFGGEYNYRYIYAMLQKQRPKIQIDENIKIDNVKYSCNSINGEINCVYGLKRHGDNFYLENIYQRKDLKALTWHRTKKYKISLLYYFIVPVVVILLFIYKRKQTRIQFGDTIVEKNGYVLMNGKHDSNNSLLKLYKQKDMRFAHESNILRKVQRHNVVKFFSIEKHKGYNCIVLECSTQIARQLSTNEMYQIITTLYDLQKRGVSYNNLSIENIFTNSHDEVILMNFECAESIFISLNASENANSVLLSEEENTMQNAKGCKNWRCPEFVSHDQGLLDLTSEILLKGDSFSFGILLYFNEKGKTPFEHNSVDPEENILTGDYNLEYISNHALHDLICHCLAPSFVQRISIPEIYNHPYFWSAEKSFNFLAHLSDFIEMKNNESSRVFLRLERNKSKVFVNKWTSYIESIIENELTTYRIYNEKNIKGLLRAIRNKGRHFKELPEEIKQIYGSFPIGYMQYYFDRFPSLLMVSHYSAKCVRNDELMSEFYCV